MSLPTWFLIGALFLPRVCLLCAYFSDVAPVRALSGFVPIALGVALPRIVVILLIHATLGWSWWLVPHGLALAMVYLSAGSNSRRRSKSRRRLDDR